jgi:hypothetical protein
MPISFTNSRFPCLDLGDSCLTAMRVPSDNLPCIEFIVDILHDQTKGPMINWDNMQENIRVTDLVYGAKSTFSNFASGIKIVSGSSQLPQSEGTSFQI